MTSLGYRLISSSGLLLLIQLVNRSVGLISTLVLARLLTPADFGVVAIVSILVILVETLSDAGSEQYIIQKKSVDKADLNTAWTINVLIKWVLWIVLIIAAPAMTNYIGSPELSNPVRIASISLIISSMSNPGIFLLKKNLQYRKILHLSVTQKILTFVLMMSHAFISPSYWVFIVGGIASSTIWVIGSYIIHPYKPALKLSRFSQQIWFSQWLIYRSFFGFVRSQIDMLLITKNFAIAEVGVFHLVRSLSYMPIQDVIAPAVGPLLAGFAQSSHDGADVGANFRMCSGFILFLIAPLCVYIGIFPHLIIDVLLGSQWSDASTLLVYMTPMLFVLALGQVYENVCIGMGLVKEIFYYNVLSTLFLIMSLYALINDDLEQFILVRTLLGVLTSLVFLLYLSTLIKIRLPRFLLLCSPMFPTSFAAGMVTHQAELLLPESTVIRLFVTTVIFFSVYLCCMVTIHLIFTRKTPEYARIVALLSSVAQAGLNGAIAMSSRRF